MSKTKRGKERRPNHVKPAPRKQLGQETTTMKLVEEPVFGHFYALDHRQWSDRNNGYGMIDLYSGRRGVEQEYYHGGGMWEEGEPVTLAEIPSGSIVYFLGKHYLKELRGEFYRIGYDEYFGYVKTSSVVFYDLGEL